MTTAAPKHNLIAGIVAAVLGALAGAVLWAVIASTTDFKIGYAAVGVGALTGLLAGKAGGGHPRLPLVAAGIGLLGCVVGDILIEAHVGANALGVSSFTVITDYTQPLWEAYKYDFDALSGVFYVIAAVAAFRLATQHTIRQQQTVAAPPEPPRP
ncbi:MAG: hypothetical protein JWM02_1934 [Frankiales bacterium]|nr:hypothetical protein [Frankiales bacterium]